MSLKKILIVSVVLVLMLVVGVGVIYAQGGGNGGGGNGGGTGNPGGARGNNAQQWLDGGISIYDEAGTIYRRGGRGGANTLGGSNFGLVSTLPPANAVAPSEELVDLMIDGIMDEYYAYLTYDAIIENFGEVWPFTNIQRAEQQHIDAWAFIFTRYGLEVPAEPTDFIAPTFESVEAACVAGAEAEIANFALYDTMFEAFSAYPDIQQVVLALRNASEYNHLVAFQTCAQ